jgi:hypothetical protein
MEPFGLLPKVTGLALRSTSTSSLKVGVAFVAARVSGVVARLAIMPLHLNAVVARLAAVAESSCAVAAS